MTEWFMTIYSRSLPWSSVLRVWDMFLTEGKITFETIHYSLIITSMFTKTGIPVLFKVGIYLVDVALKGETHKTCPTMYETIQKLRNIPRAHLGEQALMKGLKSINLADGDMVKMHKAEYKKLQKTKKKQQQQQQQKKSK